MYGKKWSKIAKYVGTRNRDCVQKFGLKFLQPSFREANPQYEDVYKILAFKKVPAYLSKRK